MSIFKTQTSATLLWRKFIIPAIMVCVLLLWFSGVLSRFENIFWDNFLSFQQEKVQSDILIVEIDSKSIDTINNWPWNRSVYSQAIEKIIGGNPQSLFIDVDFSSYSNDPEADKKLFQTVADVPESIPILLPTFLQKKSSSGNQLSARLPLEELAPNVQAVSVNINPETDGLVRKVKRGFTWENIFYTSAWNAIANSNINSSWIDYSISVDSFQYVSIIDLLDNKIRSDQFKSKHVLLGSTAIELGDIVPVPVIQAVPGVVLHGLAVETLLRGGLFKLSSLGTFFLLIIIGFLAARLVKQSHWANGLIVAAIFYILQLPIIYFVYHKFNLILPLFPSALMIVSIYFTNLILQLDDNIFQKLLLQIALTNKNKLLESIFSVSNECILCVDNDGVIISANARSSDIFSCENSELTGKNVAAFLPDVDFKNWKLQQKPFDTHLLDINANNQPVEICISPIDSSNEKTFTVAIRSIKERVERENALKFSVEYDNLTHLFNREQFFKLANERLANARNGYLIKINIDYFGEINSRFGHIIGDQVLQCVVERISNSIDKNALTSRMGKNELAILITDTDNGQTSHLSDILISHLNKPVVVNGNEIEVFCRLGIASEINGSNNIEGLVRHSNAALDTARKKGLECDWYIHGEVAPTMDRLSILGAIRQSLRQSEFDLAFQPKIDLISNEFIGCEVLLRTNKDWNRSINITTLIETAEKSSLIAPLTLWVINKIISLEEEWKKNKLPKSIAINLSVGLMGNTLFFDRLLTRLDSTLGYFKFTLEITETHFSNDWDESIVNLQKLHDRHIDISVDDYGTGYSSLSYLRDLNAKELKIDRSFVTNINTNSGNQSIVRSTVKMAHELGMSVIAEGIETSEELQFLVDCGCDIGQGYLFAKPMAFSQLQEFSQSLNPVLI